MFTSEDGPNEQKSNDDKILDTALNLCKKSVEEKKGLHRRLFIQLQTNFSVSFPHQQVKFVILSAKSSFSPPIVIFELKPSPTTSRSESCMTL